MKQGEEISFDLAEKRYGWLQVVKGSLELNGEKLQQSDGAAVSEENSLHIKATEDDTEFILFDLA